MRRKLNFLTDSENYRCTTGNASLGKKLGEGIGKFNGKFELNAKVTQIEETSTGVIIHYGEQKSDPFDVVVIAAPPTTWDNIKPVGFEFPRKPQFGTVRKCFVTSNTNEWKYADIVTADNYMDAITWSENWDASRTKSAPYRKALFVGGSFCDQFEEEIIQQNLNKYYSGLQVEKLQLQKSWEGYSCPNVKEITEFPISNQVKDSKRLYLVGEYASNYEWFGFMEGALRSGHQVADKIKKIVHIEKL